ncbi:uncharacterized protein V1518DRAFT_420313 [Limtongia smithiae]|uniref:uncharacterized protein n=1 Tax=Limtongia smithiae TaxID=1125753 RepID=UPI0034CDED59
MTGNRPIHIANVSGATGDAPHEMLRMLRDAPDIDAITGDWLSEMNISWNAIEMRSDPTSGYDAGFLRQFTESIDLIHERKVKIVTNAGALNPSQLVLEIRALCKQKGYTDLKVAQVDGDNITSIIPCYKFPHLDHETPISTWDKEPAVGVAYIGCRGIVAALDAGSDIVICGRCTDASPVIGLAAWWHHWDLDSDLDKLAAGLIAGHLIECGPYVAGANFSGFKPYLDSLVDLGFPIAEISSDGAVVITKQPNSNGVVLPETVKCQLLYELQGELYYNPDVTADLSGITVTGIGPHRVQVSGVKGLPPPDTTKVLISGIGGYQAEALFFINGLDVAEKAQLMRNQLEHAFKNSEFSKLTISLIGLPAENPSNQSAGTCLLRVFAQAPTKEGISAAKFKIPIYAIRMQSYAGYHMDLDFRMMDPRMFMEIWPATIPVAALHESAILHDGTRVSASAAKHCIKYPLRRSSYETANRIPLYEFGPTVDAPLGYIVHARSGDKANNSNVGFFVRNADEYPWLQSLMTCERLRSLFGDDISEKTVIERCEFPKIYAVHFRIMDFLDGGIASSSRIDGLGKGVGEFLRSKYVPLPEKFLSRGRI